jgi:hypothetical protein
VTGETAETSGIVALSGRVSLGTPGIGVVPGGTDVAPGTASLALAT